MKRPRGSMTAAEHEEWLKSTGQYDAIVERQRQVEEERQKRTAELQRAEGPLVGEWRDAGYAVASVWDLVNTASSYANALPILLAHLQRPYPAAVRDGIARALAVSSAAFGWSTLVRLYRDEQDERVKDGLAVSVAAVASNELVGELIALARDESLGLSRILLLSGLERSPDPRARAALMDLDTDPALQKEIQVILRRVKRKKKK